MNELTREMLDWPPTVDVPTAGRPLGLGREAAYAMAARGELPGAFRVGRRWRVVTARLIEFLRVESANGDAGGG